MRFLLLVTVLFLSFAASAADKQTEVFTLDHQMSQMCKKKITENLRFEKGISKIDVSLKDNTITITYDPSKTDPEKLITAFKKIGFNAMVYCPDTVTPKPEECDELSNQQCPKPEVN